MFENSRVIKNDPYDRLPEADLQDAMKPSHLDSDEVVELHKNMLSHYIRELDRQYNNRKDMAIDEDYYDSIQWSDEDRQMLMDRGQAPLVYNVISQTINWIIGSEKRSRTDFKILPREKNDARNAEVKTQILKYLSDVNRTAFHKSRAFEDTVKVGIGWLEDGVKNADEDDESIYSRYESWRNMLWDSSSTEMDLSDSRYVFRTKWVDEDIVEAFFPERKDLVRASGSTAVAGFSMYGDVPMDSQELEIDAVIAERHTTFRPRLRLIEAWFKAPSRDTIIQGGMFQGQDYDENNQEMVAEIQAGKARVVERNRMRMHLMIFTADGVLFYGKSPYRHNRFPFTPIWGYRRGRDNLPYGVIRSIRDIQDDINKRASKAQYILSTNKIVMDRDAVDDIVELQEQAALPNGIIRKKPNSFMQLNVDRDLAPAHLELMSRSIGMIQSVSGVTDELMGRTTNAVSGAAVSARQEQGALSTSKLFDNLRLANQIQGEKQLSLIEQFFSEAKTVRIVNSRGTPTYIQVNDGLPDNDITRVKADYIISDADWRVSIRQSQAEQLMEILTRMPPNVSMVILDLVVESMDIANREEIVNRIRNVTGQADPDVDENSPEYQERMMQQQAQAVKAAEAEQLQQAIIKAQIDKTSAQAAKVAAEIEKTRAEMVSENVKQQKMAAEVGVTFIQNPRSNEVADIILRESRFVSDSELNEAKAQEEAEQQQLMQAQMQQQQAMQQQQSEPQGQAQPNEESPLTMGMNPQPTGVEQ